MIVVPPRYCICGGGQPTCLRVASLGESTRIVKELRYVLPYIVTSSDWSLELKLNFKAKCTNPFLLRDKIDDLCSYKKLYFNLIASLNGMTIWFKKKIIIDSSRKLRDIL